MSIAEEYLINQLSKKPYSVYDLTYSPNRKLAREWYLKREEVDNYQKMQVLHKAFIDIEVFTKFEYLFPEPKEAKYPISSVSLCFSNNNDYYVFLNKKEYLEYGGDVNQLNEIAEYIRKGIEENYRELFEDEYNINIILCNDEKELIENLFNTIHNYDPLIIAGFNSVNFDFPYIYHRIQNLGLRSEDYMTKFGEIDYIGYEIDTPDYKYVDLKYLYEPDSGMGFGKSLESYSLNSVANVELGFSKVSYDEDNLDDLFIKNIKDYAFYNLIDAVLLKKLDAKLNHIQLFNSLRRMARSLFHIGYKGRSFLGEDLIRFLLYKHKNFVTRDFLQENKIPFNKKEKFSSYYLSLKNFGAYVKTPPNDIFRGLIVDYDQTSMYPSINVMFNIDFSTLQAKVYPIFTSQFLRYIVNLLYKQYRENMAQYVKLIEKLTTIFHIIADTYARMYSPPQNNKNEFIKYNTHYTINLLTAIIEDMNRRNVSSFEEYLKIAPYYITVAYIYPLIENITHLFSIFEKEINLIAYYYLVSKDDNTALQYLTNVYKVILPKDIFGQKFINNIIQLYLNNFEDFENVQVIVVFNPTDSIIRFDLVKLKDVYQILFKKYIVTPTGVLFT